MATRLDLLPMRRPTNALAALLCAAVALVGRALADGDLCEPFTVQSRLGTAQFNLAPLASMYRVQDAVDTYERNYTYYFSVCYDMDPSVMNFPSACNSTEAGYGSAPAFQVFNTQNGCHRLGRTHIRNSWGAIDNNPAKGVFVVYKDGDACPAYLGPNVTRELNISFICADVSALSVLPRVFELSGTNVCHYRVEIRHMYACPTTCAVANRRLCGGHGFCDYDVKLGAPRCFCNPGYYGPDCNSATPLGAASSSSSCGGECIALIFVVVLLGGLGIAGSVLWYQLRKSQQLNIRFGQLRENFMAASQGGGRGDSDDPPAQGATADEDA